MVERKGLEIKIFVYGTGNPTKLISMRRMVKALNLEIKGLDEINADLPEVDETGNTVVRYSNAIYLVMDDNEIYDHFGDEISSEAFYIVDIPHIKRVEGFPLDCAYQ